MEPDYPNAKYWFRKAGSHLDGERLQKETLVLFQNSENEGLYQKFAKEKEWNPALLTELVESSLQENRTEEQVLLEQIQALELCFLLEVVLGELEIR
jgi:hypothetical protein